MTAKMKTTESGTPKKKAAKKKAAATKKKSAAPKQKAPAKKKATSPEKKASIKKDTAAEKTKADGGESSAPPSRPEGSISSMDVTLGHVFALRPRINKSFRQNDLSQARRSLANETYADLAEATRAVAEEALAITRTATARPDKRRRI